MAVTIQITNGDSTTRLELSNVGKEYSKTKSRVDRLAILGKHNYVACLICKQEGKSFKFIKGTKKALYCSIFTHLHYQHLLSTEQLKLRADKSSFNMRRRWLQERDKMIKVHKKSTESGKITRASASYRQRCKKIVKEWHKVPGNTLRGEQVGNAKLTEDRVKKLIYDLRYGTKSLQQLADKYQVSDGLIFRILYGQLWKHLTGGKIVREQGTAKKSSKKFSPSQVKYIRKLLDNGYYAYEIADKMKCHRVTIDNIKKRTKGYEQ